MIGNAVYDRPSGSEPEIRRGTRAAKYVDGAAGRSARLLLVPLALSVACHAVSAQDSTRTTASCDGKIVSAIAITPRDPSFISVPRRLRKLARGVGLLHTTTKAEVIDRFLLLDVGQRCTERRLAESERILRLQPFLADATVRAVPDSAGGVRIEV